MAGSKLKLKTILSITKSITSVGKTIPLLQTASEIVEQIQVQIEIQVHNEEMWKVIKERVCIAQERLNKHKLDEREYSRAYENYIEVLRHIELYVEVMGNKEGSDNKIHKKLKSFVKASHVSI